MPRFTTFRFRYFFARRLAAVVTAGATAVAGTAAPITLVEDGQPRAVIVAATTESRPARELQEYIERVSGAKLTIMVESESSQRPHAGRRIYVGPGAAAARVVDLEKLQPEGFVIKTEGQDLYIVGRDETDAGLKVKGTFYGVCEFLERYLGVRWLMNGPVGVVAPKRATIRVPSVDIREEPLLWQRKIRNVKNDTNHHATLALKAWGLPDAAWKRTFAAEHTDFWYAHQRMGRRVNLKYGHSYTGWWDKYHEQYPDIFALQPDGTRINTNVRERLCVSNPKLWDLVAQAKIEELRARPLLTAASISPNDGSADNRFCSCERCRSWDSPAVQALYRENPHLNPGPGGGPGPFPALTDRYFRFYNEVARRVKRVLPDRYLGCYAYSVYQSPPVVLDHLEDNLIVGYVGMRGYTNASQREQDRREWLAWSKLAKQLFLRPNLLWGGQGMPLNYVHRMAEDLRFYADHGMRATDFDGGTGNWGTQGLNYYVLARLLWDPHQPVDAIIDDYCRAAYGSGAAAMKEYYQRLEDLTTQIADESTRTATKDPWQRAEYINEFASHYTDARLAELQECVDRAMAAIGTDGDPAALERVRMVATGLEYARKTRDLLAAAAAVRAGKGSLEAYKKIEAETLRYYRGLALSWAVSVDHDYYYVRRGLVLERAPSSNS